MSENDLIGILQRTISADAQDQQTALTYIAQASTQNFPEFLKLLSKILANTQNVPFVRQAAGLQLKNTLFSNDEARRADFLNRWSALPQIVQEEVKHNVLQTLGTEARPSSAAQCISAIACFEIPQGKWANIIDILKANVTTPQSTECLKESSLEAMGYICQSLASNVLEAFANDVLTAIVFGMRAEEPSMHVKLAATNALLNSLDFTHVNFGNERERNVIMQVVCHTTQAQDTLVKVAALQCLVKIMSLYYQYMEKYMSEALFPITMNAMKSECDDIVLQGIEFWSNVCEEESGLAIEAAEAAEEGRAPNQVSKHYALGALSHIIPILTETLTKQEENPEDDEWIPAKAASVCIMLLAQCCRDAVIDPTLPFISANFGNANWHYREAAVMAFGSILDGPEPTTLLRLVEEAIQPLIQRINDEHMAVRDTAIWAVGRVCDTCVELVSKPDVIQALLPALFISLQQPPRIASNACWSISSLVKATYQTAVSQGTDANGEPETFFLSQAFQSMISELIKVSDRPDATPALRNAAYEALMELIKNSPKDCYKAVQETTLLVMEKMRTLLTVEETLVTAVDRAQLRDLISQLCATLQSVLRKIHDCDAPLIAEAIMSSLLLIMTRYQGRDNGAIMEEALMAVSALISVLKVGFERYMEQFRPILFHALENYQDREVCVNAIGVITDLCGAFEGRISAYADEIITRLVHILQESTADKELKCHIISLLGDFINSLGIGYVRYLPVTMQFVEQAVEASALPVVEDDYDQVDYINNLRESCIIVFIAMAQSFNNADDEKNVFIERVPVIVRLLTSIAASRPAAPDHVLAQAFSLVGDLICVLGAQIVPFLDSEPVTNIMQRLRRSKQAKAKTALNWVSREIQRIKRNSEK